MTGKSLTDEIREFRQKKWRWAGMLFVIGLAGLVLPVLPGLLAIAVGIWLLLPTESERIWRRLRHALNLK